MDENNKKDFSYILGRAFGVVLVGCLAAISIACTVKVIMLIL